MPIKIPDDLPAVRTLEAEGVAVMREADAVRQDIRPLRIGLLNLMPDKISAETQIARLIGATPLQVELTLVRLSSHAPRNAAPDHMAAFYRSFDEIEHERFDGFIVTGAPVERLPFEEVRYWEELGRIFDWTQAHVHRTLAICWAAQAALNHFHGAPKHELSAKASGVFRQSVVQPASPYLRGMSDGFAIPVSRWTETRRADLPEEATVLAESAETGLCLVEEAVRGLLCSFNHAEYDTATLANEYFRDAALGDTPVPANYFPDDDPTRPPENGWRSHAHLLFGNWINEIYQTTPYEAAEIGRGRREG